MEVQETKADPLARGPDVPATPLPHVVITPPRGFPALRLGELWDSRDLLYFLVWRDVKVRYKQTFFGVAWAVMQPLFTMIIFSIFFGALARLPSDGVPYPVFTLAALLPWQLFAGALGNSANSLVGSQALIKKVYFPRLVIPAAAVLEGLPDFLVALVLLVGAMAIYGIAPTANIIWLPALVALALATAFAVGLWLAAVNVQYRDVRYTIPFLVQLWLFASPVAYSSSLVPEPWRALYGLNPMAGVVDGFRWALFGQGAAPGAILAVSTAAVIVILASGLAYFRAMERTFADVL